MKRDILREFNAALRDRSLDSAKPEDLDLYVRGLHPQSDGCDLIKQLAAQIDWDEGSGTYLFTGSPGSGKTTELYRLRADLLDRNMDVFFVDIGERLHTDSPVDITTFLLAMMDGLGEEIRKLKGANVTTRSYMERLQKFLQSDVKIEGMELSAETGLPGDSAKFTAGLKLALHQDPDFKQRLQVQAKNYVSRFVSDARQFVRESLDAVANANNGKCRKTVLIVDSAEKFRGIGDQASVVYGSVHDLFARHAESLRFSGLHIVYTIPQYLMAAGGNIASLYTGGTVYALASTHLYARRSRTVEQAGLDRMVEIVTRRFPECCELIDTSLLEDIARISGGDIRDYLRILRLCLAKAQQTVPQPYHSRVTRELADGAIAMARRDMLPIAEEDRSWLKRIASTHEACLQKIEELPTFGRFCDHKMVLNYRNGDDWYDVHPLLWDVVGKEAT